MSEPSQFLLYTAPDGAVKVDVFFKEETAYTAAEKLPSPSWTARFISPVNFAPMLAKRKAAGRMPAPPWPGHPAWNPLILPE